MTNRQLEERVRAWYRAEVAEGLQPPASLRSRVLSVPDAIPRPMTLLGGLNRRTVLLLAAGALLAAAAVGSIAVGAGLLRIPGLETSDPGEASGRCIVPLSELREGDLLLFRLDSDEQPAREDDPPAGKRIRLLQDGLLITERYQTARQIEAVDSAMTARRLSPHGIELLLGAVQESSLMRGCLGRHTDLPYRSIEVRTGEGVARAAWGLGYRGEFIHLMTPEEKEAAVLLESRLEHPEDWLPADAWLAAAERGYVPDHWLVVIWFVPAEMAYSYGRSSNASGSPAAEDVVLLDDTTLLRFGREWREPDLTYTNGDGTPRTQAGQRGRCAVVDASEARAITTTLNATSSRIFNGSWWFRDGRDQVAVHVRPLRPPDSECSPHTLGVAPESSPSPTSAPPPPPVGDLGTLDPCAFLSESSVNAILPFSEEFPVTALDADEAGYPSTFGPDYRVCNYSSPEGGSNVTLGLRVMRTSAADASALARELLGDGFTAEALDGRLLWLNNCMGPQVERGSDGVVIAVASCGSAVAVSLEPYFAVIDYDVRGEGVDPRAVGRDLAAALTSPVE